MWCTSTSIAGMPSLPDLVYFLLLKILNRLHFYHFLIINSYLLRFLDMETEEASSYRAVFSGVLEQLRRLCIRVNQTLLLSSLHDTLHCDVLLEPEQADDSWSSGDLVLSRIKSWEGL